MHNLKKAQLISPLLTAFLLTLTALLAANAPAAAAVISEQIALCLNTLIPSLFGCTALAVLLQSTGACAWLSSKLRILQKLLRCDAEITGIFLVSQIAGYPVGALLLNRAVRSGRLSTQHAAVRSCFCFGGGPAFLVGLAGVQLFGCPAAGWWMLAACCCSNLLLGVLLRPKQKAAHISDAPAPAAAFSRDSLPDAVSAAMQSLARICGTVLFFGIIRLFCEWLGILPLLIRIGLLCGLPAQTTRAFFAVLTDVSQLPLLFSCGLPLHILLPLCAGFLSFGGLCVHCQCLALGCGIKLRKLLLFRLAAAVLSACLMLPAAHFLPLSGSAAVFAQHAAISRSGSVFPSLLIFCTGFPLLIKKD